MDRINPIIRQNYSRKERNLLANNKKLKKPTKKVDDSP